MACSVVNLIILVLLYAVKLNSGSLSPVLGRYVTGAMFTLTAIDVKAIERKGVMTMHADFSIFHGEPFDLFRFIMARCFVQ